MKTFCFVTNVVKYYMEDLMEPGLFHECSEQCFSDCVTRFYGSYDRSFDGPNVQVFTDRETGLRYKRVETSEPCTRSFVLED